MIRKDSSAGESQRNHFTPVNPGKGPGCPHSIVVLGGSRAGQGPGMELCGENKASQPSACLWGPLGLGLGMGMAFFPDLCCFGFKLMLQEGERMTMLLVQSAVSPDLSQRGWARALGSACPLTVQALPSPRALESPASIPRPSCHSTGTPRPRWWGCQASLGLAILCPGRPEC